MSILLWLLFGAIVGYIASAIMKSNTSIVADIILGIVGAMVGGFLVSLFGGQSITGFDLYSILVAVLGAIVLIWLVRAIRAGGTTVSKI